MSYHKENETVQGPVASPASPSKVKPEPTETRILGPTTSWQLVADEQKPIVKPEPLDAPHFEHHSTESKHDASTSLATSSNVAKAEDVPMSDLSLPRTRQPEEEVTSLFQKFNAATDIAYLPEDALKAGLGMVKTIKADVGKLDLGQLRKEVWMREIQSLENQGSPSTMIAVCGATGAGKSSILNAILDDNIVPTSGMRACTAVVTEISHHKKKTVDADVSFLSEAEWRQELGVLLDDLVDEDGRLKRANDLKSDAGVAWQKVHAVYPTIVQEMLVGMSVDQIIARDPKIAKILGTTKNIVAKDSKAFAVEIGKYIDSKDQKRGEKKKKDKKKNDQDGQGSLMDLVHKQVAQAMGSSSNSRNKDRDDRDDPALWPLIRQVKVRCPSACLSTGVVLVDLPGVGDSNAARNNIAKAYMKECDCIWILAPITRAVDDKTAKDLLGDAFKMQLMMDGNYDAHAITFIASKCDDISCSEVIRALHLEDDPELEEIEERIDQFNDETKEWKSKKTTAEKLIQGIDGSLKEVRSYLREYEGHLDALENGTEFTPRLTAKGAQKASKKSKGKKRKNTRGGKGGSPKRRKSVGADSDEDEDADMDDISDILSVGDSDDDTASDKDSDSDSGSDGDSDASKSDADSDEETGNVDDEEEEVTEESLQAKINEAKEAIKACRAKLNDARKEKKEASDMLATIKKKEAKAQKEKNAFCSLKRSEFSRDVLKEDFRAGLKELDDATGEERNPDTFDPTVNVRDYDAIDLPVFTCSARDYVRIKNQVKGDGEPSCFSSPNDTGIPALQQWCHSLTVSSRERSARNFLLHIKTFANSVRDYVQGIGDVTAADRDALREKWESSEDTATPEPVNAYAMGGYEEDPFDMPGLAGFGAGLYSMDTKPPKPAKVDAQGEKAGVTPRLTRDFSEVVDDSVQELQDCFRDGLEEKCKTGAANAADAAVSTSDNFAASMHWATYRATLRRHGEWRANLNVELTSPFTKNIATSWSKVFEADLFASFEKATQSRIEQLLKDVQASAPPGLHERVRLQGAACLEEARLALQKTIDVVRETLTAEQKEVSRCLAPHVQNELREGYDRAMEERGTGSVARQKLLFHNYVNGCKDEVFNGGAEVLLERLASAAEAVGRALDSALEQLAQKIEVNLAVLWEGPGDDPKQARVRAEVVDSVANVHSQALMWLEAERSRSKSSTDDE